MASTTTTTINTALRRHMCSSMRTSALRISHPSSSSARCLWSTRPYSTEKTTTDAPPPPLLSKLKADLKTAMRAKDAPRLSVLRNILAATTNAAKTSSPIRTDGQLIALMRKTARGNHEAREEALKASRQDLVEKEEAQIRVIDEYVAGTGVKVVEEEELRGIVEGVVREAKAGGKKQGEVMKELLGKNWDDEGKYVDKAVLSKIAKETWEKN